jgi:uncharacterized protein (DUF433 family)
MTIVAVAPGIVRRSDRGLAIDGTRITLFDVMGYLRQEWPPNLIRDWLDLTDEQIAAAMTYIAEHGDELAAAYEQMLQEGEELRRHYEARQAELMRAVANRPRTPEEAALRARLEEAKARKGIR